MRNDADAKNMKASWLLTGVLAIFYALLAHYVSTTPNVGVWAIPVAGAPMLLAAAGMLRVSRFGLLLVLAAISILILLSWFWPTLDNPAAWLYFLQGIGLDSALAVLFGRTLVAGRQPLVTMLATATHDKMSPEVLRYTRQVTVAWTLFFVVCLILSITLFFAAPIEVWSWFANIMVMPLISLMFIAEYAVRKCVLPKRDQTGFFAAVRTVRAVRANFRQ
jgi:uncharacterized membrane protein